MLRKWYYNCVFFLVLAEVLLILVSWLLSVAMKESVRSLISAEGIRWFFGRFTEILASPLLAYLLLLSMACGCLWHCGILSDMFRHSASRNYRHRMALWSTIGVLGLYVIAILILTMIPHAILLSATGSLFPSPFSRSIIPVISFGFVLISAVYGRLSGHFKTPSDIIDSLLFGIAKAAPLFLIYLLVVQLYESLMFVF